MLWGLIKTGKTYGLANIWSYVPEEPISLLSGINMVVGLIMCGAITSCDYTRYCKKSSDVAIVGLVGFMVISVFQQIGAAIIALGAPTWNIVEVLGSG